MGLFSFGKKNDVPRQRGARGSLSSERIERRTRRSAPAHDAASVLLDPALVEKQRARRRLVGAIALVVAAVIILPMVLDSQPKPLTGDIDIDIPERPALDATQVPHLNPLKKGRASQPDTNVATPAGVLSHSANSAPSTSTPTSPSASAQTAASGKPQQPPATAAKPVQATRPKVFSANTHFSSASSANIGARFVVQLGSFPDDASAREWLMKLKAQGMPAYLEHRSEADGVTRTLLRAGPFADRAAASAAVAKVREAGLMTNAAATANRAAERPTADH